MKADALADTMADILRKPTHFGQALLDVKAEALLETLADTLIAAAVKTLSKN